VNRAAQALIPPVRLMNWSNVSESAVHRGVLQNPGPLAPSSVVGLGRVSGAPNDGGKRVVPIRYFQPLVARQAPDHYFDHASPSELRHGR
jgi:hypothetical protein